MRRWRIVSLAVLSAAGILAAAVVRAPERRAASAAAVVAPTPTPAPVASSSESAECALRPLKLPTGALSLLSCSAARTVTSQVRTRIAMPVTAPDEKAFKEALTGWLDPHGLWSAAPDAPTRAALDRQARALLAEIQLAPDDQSRCEAARSVAGVLRSWVAELGSEFDGAAEAARTRSLTPAGGRVLARASEGIFQDDPVTRPARELARDLGTRVGEFQRAFGDANGATRAARSQLLPSASLEAWTGVVLSAAVRAYVPAVDTHGQWVPLDEELSLYSADPAMAGEPRLWDRMERAALGVRILTGATPPLANGDLVLAVGKTATAGLSVEQVEQLSHLEAVQSETSREVSVLRVGERAPRTLSVSLELSEGDGEAGLSARSIPYAAGNVLVITIPDVSDDLGDQLEELVADAGRGRDAPLGIVLDLRGNGGGSIDGAVGAIGVFLPGVPSFPLRHRDGEVEIGHATTPPVESRWQGPVATLVDGYTASAAEMLAGAIGLYQRGRIVGARTFGKGCVQEYFDDKADVGVLRLTTMLFSLPDGSALQGVGLTPDVVLPLPSVSEREKILPGALDPWKGPDVRASAAMGGPEFPPHRGHVGPCADAWLCTALARLGAPSARRSASNVPKRLVRSASP
jgi:carboxyl-terminal processing protease